MAIFHMYMYVVWNLLNTSTDAHLYLIQLIRISVVGYLPTSAYMHALYLPYAMKYIA